MNRCKCNGKCNGKMKKGIDKRMRTHSKHHSKKHMNMMRHDIQKGMSFKQAHQKAIKRVGR